MEVNRPIIKVIGIEQTGYKTIDRMIKAGLSGPDYIAIDNNYLEDIVNQSRASTRFIIKTIPRKGLDAGWMDPKIGREDAEQYREDFSRMLRGADFVFILTALGDTTGTGTSPVLAEEAKKLGVTTIAMVTFPATYSGKFLPKNAEDGIADLRSKVDTLVVLPLDNIFESDFVKTDRWNANIKLDEFYHDIVPDYLWHGAQCILNVMSSPQTPTAFSFCDVKSALQSRKGISLYGKMGTGRAYGQNRAADAVRKAISIPILEESPTVASSILMYIAGPANFSSLEIKEAVSTLTGVCDPNTNVFYTCTRDNNMEYEVAVTIISLFEGYKYKSLIKPQDPYKGPRPAFPYHK